VISIIDLALTWIRVHALPMFAAASHATSGWIRRTRIHYFRRVDRNAKCPACGHRLGDIVFSVDLRLLVHKCFICRAEWGEKPLLVADAWLAKPAAPVPDDPTAGY
jgi:hypothetical protein